MSIPAPYLQITGHPVGLNKNAYQVYSDEFKHVIVHYYVSATNDPRYRDVVRRSNSSTTWIDCHYHVALFTFNLLES